MEQNELTDHINHILDTTSMDESWRHYLMSNVLGVARIVPNTVNRWFSPKEKVVNDVATVIAVLLLTDSIPYRDRMALRTIRKRMLAGDSSALWIPVDMALLQV
jgi:hypothetical protein